MSIEWNKKYWDVLSAKEDLCPVIDPLDETGTKNRNINRIHQKVLSSFFRDNKIESVDSILDFGCGIGRNHAILSGLARSYTGTDLSFGMLKKATGDRCTFDGLRLPFRDNAFDMVFSFWTLQHIVEDSDLTSILLEFSRCLKSRGTVIICERSSHTTGQKNMSRDYINRRLPQQYIKLFKSCGLMLKKIERLDYRFDWRRILRRFNEEGENLYCFIKSRS